jgi:transcriptional regulator with XRE-family HTH domain
MISITEVSTMETKDVILELRTKRGLSQDDLAEKVMVTRQAVSRWENGETVPNTDTLKLLSSWNVNLAETDALEFWRIWILF